jgi:hypothetical protein
MDMIYKSWCKKVVTNYVCKKVVTNYVCKKVVTNYVSKLHFITPFDNMGNLGYPRLLGIKITYWLSKFQGCIDWN